jgi:hypothetical protein
MKLLAAFHALGLSQQLDAAPPLGKSDNEKKIIPYRLTSA